MRDSQTSLASKVAKNKRKSKRVKTQKSKRKVMEIEKKPDLKSWTISIMNQLVKTAFICFARKLNNDIGSIDQVSL